MPLQATSGAASYDAYGGGVAAIPNYIEDVFSTWLYTGTGAAQTITNGIDLSTKGGLVWIKDRTTAGYPHRWFDTVRGGTKSIRSNTTGAETTGDPAITFSTTGFTTSTDVNGEISASGENFASWTFRKQPKFFDVVTWTGDGTTSRTISHNLGSAPGCIFVKRTDTTGNWVTLLGGYQMLLNTSDPESATTVAKGYIFNSLSTTFSVGTGGTSNADVNASGGTYVAYLFAHNAGGFGLTGTDNVISCGSVTGTGSLTNYSLGYEPQWLLLKKSSGTGDWFMMDNMRGWPVDSAAQLLRANTADAEQNATFAYPTSTGFAQNGANGATYIYIAIRRGPMKVPTDATKVFALDSLGGTLPNPPGFNAGFPVDLGFFKYKSGTSDWSLGDRLRGAQELYTNLTSAEVARADFKFDYQDGWLNSTGVASTIQSFNFQRAPGFFDVVCYTGDSTARTLTHNLTVVPELMIVKNRTNNNGNQNWQVYVSALGNTSRLQLNTTDSVFTGTFIWNNTSPTASVFSLGTSAFVNGGSDTYVAYLFATCAGVSKVGSYTGNGTTQTINCGFTAGARFVLIKRTDSTGDWYVWDTARGIVAGNDPYLLLNSTAAEVTSTDYIDTASTGFEISSTAPAAINANGGSFIFLAIS